MKSKYLFLTLTAIITLMFNINDLKAQWNGSCVNVKCPLPESEWTTNQFSYPIPACSCNVVIKYKMRIGICEGQQSFQMILLGYYLTGPCQETEQNIFKEVTKGLLYRMGHKMATLQPNALVDVYWASCFQNDLDMVINDHIENDPENPYNGPAYRRRPCYQNTEICCKKTYYVQILGSHAHATNWGYGEAQENIICESPCYTTCDFGVIPNNTDCGKLTDPWLFKISSQDDSEENMDSQGVNVKPNPANESLDIVYQSESKGLASLKIYDYMGKFIFENNIQILTGLNNIKLDVSQYQPGIYYFKIIFGEKIIYKSFVVN